jgi:hypothetical protein
VFSPPPASQKRVFTANSLTNTCFHYHYPNKSVFSPPPASQKRVLQPFHSQTRFHHHPSHKSVFSQPFHSQTRVFTTTILTKACFQNHLPHKSVFSQLFHLQTRVFTAICIKQFCFHNHLPHNSMFSLTYASRNRPRNNVSVHGNSKRYFLSQKRRHHPWGRPASYSIVIRNPLHEGVERTKY